MAILQSEDMHAALAQVEQVAAAVQKYLSDAPTPEARAKRAQRLVQELEAARRSAIATREHLRQQVQTVKPTTAYASQGGGEHEPWSTSL
ncbi:hypothetical protein [Paludibaculum fermentans]|uniref:Uncharacterized protein n=1 Tax=Paludibaculum fermentans TaxID=1473598 RepID=A0A7S7NSC6_PALFE|nr:hypothetical protein [Paludibaculum fermentans]QOY88873.1 hypothetical protein IRI77_02615 [Paludibaculum fermentans]